MTEVLLQPADCLFLFVDFQAGLGFGVESNSRQVLLNNAVALARTAVAFGVASPEKRDEWRAGADVQSAYALGAVNFVRGNGK